VTVPEQEEAEVPVLTEVVEEAPAAPAAAGDTAAHDALALELEAALLERLRAEIDRMSALALERVRAELTGSLREMVREAVSASLARTRRGPERD
jgi:hypothetical protein